MKRVLLSVAIALALSCPAKPLFSQARDIPSAAPLQPAGQTQEQRGRHLLDQMVTALGGPAWLDRKDVEEKGQRAAFFRGQPNGFVIQFKLTRQFADATHPEAVRIGFLTDRGMIIPGKKIDVVQIWTANTGFEVTYKGKTTLPKEQVEDYYRRNAHSVESVVRDWLKAPGVMVIAEGTTMVERRMADKISILSANNDAVTLALDATTHLPLRRSFQWRNTTFKDYDEDAEEYDDYHTIQGLPTALAITRYHNGDMASQTFLKSVEYNTGLSPDVFNPDILLKKK
ncbi:MAG: hypothetical protein ABI072_07610 [Edaphobacter sp.]